MKHDATIAVIGGGAAGFFAAIKAAEVNPSAQVTIFEKGAHVLTKVRISGGGRCNVTHACFQPKELIKNYPRGHQALLGPFHKFQPTDTIKWFESHGVPLKTEDDGRVFPTSDMSLSIINALKDAAKDAGVVVRTHAGPSSFEIEGPNQFHLNISGSESVRCQRLLLATGSNEKVWDWLREKGHTIETPVPSLFTFAVPDERLRDMAGLSVDKAEIEIAGTNIVQKGPILVTHWGLSGPAVLKLSAWGARVLYEKGYNAPLKINWTGLHKTQVVEMLRKFKSENSRKKLSVHSPVAIPHRLWESLVNSIHVPSAHGWADISNAEMERLAMALCAGTYNMRGKSTFKDEFVTCGGVCLDEIDFRTMESRLFPGLYFAGEVIDVDGVTGGFNFQNAWTTGWLAGRAMGA